MLHFFNALVFDVTILSVCSIYCCTMCNVALFYGTLLMLYYFIIALLTLHYINVLLFDVGLLDIAPLNVPIFNVNYLMLHFFM